MTMEGSTSRPAWVFESRQETDNVAQGELAIVHQVSREIVMASEGLSAFRLITGRGLNFPVRLGRLLRFREMAIAAERTGQYVRADFLWQEAHSQLCKVIKCDSDWQQLITSASTKSGVTGALTVDQARRSFVQELFLDAHWALFNGLRSMAVSPAPSHRCFLHLNYIYNLKRDCSELCFQDDAAFVNNTKREIAALREAKQWDNAYWLAKLDLVERFPDKEEYVNLAADVQWSATLETISGEDSEKALIKDAETISEGILRLDSLRDHAPYNLFLLDWLAELHHLRAVKLANAGKISTALVEVETAVALNSGSEKFWGSREQIIKMMTDLQESMIKVLAEIKVAPNSTLSAEGIKMKLEADLGFSLMNAFAESEVPAQLQQARQKALALAIWKEIGFDQTAAEDFRSLVLFTLLSKVAEQEPQSEPEIRNLWTKLSADDPALAALDANAITSFLTNRLLKDADAPEPQPEPQPEEATPGTDPMIVPETDKKRFSLEPFMLWLFSRQAKWVKAEFALALLMICLTLGLGIRETVHRNVRNAAYSQITQASSQGDDVAIIEKSEQFLANSVIAPDPRQEEVEALYSEALVRWSFSHDPESDAAQRHFERFRKLVPVRQPDQ